MNYNSEDRNWDSQYQYDKMMRDMERQYDKIKRVHEDRQKEYEESLKSLRTPVYGRKQYNDPTDNVYDPETGIYGPRKNNDYAIRCASCGNGLSIEEVSNWNGRTKSLPNCQDCADREERETRNNLDDLDEIDRMLAEEEDGDQ